LRLRPLHQYGPPEPRTGRGNHRPHSLAALTFGLLACGGDDDTAPPADGGSTASPTSQQANLVATSAIPDVDGFERSVAEKIAAPGGIDIAFSAYRKKGTTEVAGRMEVRIYKDEATAKADYPAQALGWKNPPPGIFGGTVVNTDSPPLASFAEATAYRAQSADAQGLRIYTDVYRIGRVIVVQHVLSKADAEAATVRKAISDAARAKVS
jgi:hypothetical protein